MQACYSDYLRCAAWSSTDEDGEPLDSYQFSDEAEKQMRSDLDAFCELVESIPNLETEYAEAGETPVQFAHDFWLTRNHHGAGFWARGLGKIGERLTNLAYSMGGVDLYLNDDTWQIEIV